MKTKKIKISKDDSASILTKRTKGEKILYGIVFGVFLIYSISLLYPLVYLLISSFQDKLVYTLNMANPKNPFALPEVWHFENYKIALSGMTTIDSLGRSIYLPEMFLNSLWFCLFQVGGSVLINAFTGYVMAKYTFKCRNFIYTLAIFSMTIPIVGTAGSTFKLLYDIGLYNTPFLVLVTSLGGFGFSFMIMYGFFKNVSWSYAESVFIEGGGHFTAFFKVMMPQAKMAMLTLAIMAFIGAWNNYMTPLLYLPDYQTVASGLYKIETSFKRDGNMPALFAGLIMSILPIIVLFACCSDLIMKNFSVGGLKG